jgi:hypothetical protein
MPLFVRSDARILICIAGLEAITQSLVTRLILPAMSQRTHQGVTASIELNLTPLVLFSRGVSPSVFHGLCLGEAVSLSSFQGWRPSMPCRLVVGLGLLAVLLNASMVSAQDGLLEPEILIVQGVRLDPVLGGSEPEITLSVADIRSYGAASLEELLADLSSLTQSSGGGRGGGAPAVLLNGRRVSGFREIRNFPPEALARVDILPEQAALKYGFRADQRVINFVLRDRFHALTTEVEWGGATAGGFTQSELGADNLRIRDDVRWNLGAEVEFRDSLLESERTIIASTPNLADRTLLPEQNDLSVTGSFNHILPGDVSATYVGAFDAQRQNALIARSDPSSPLSQQRDTVSAEASLVLSRMYPDWNWSLNASLSRRDSERRTQTDPVTGFPERNESITDQGSIEGVLFRQWFELPAGMVSSTIKMGADTRQLSTRSERSGSVQIADLERHSTNGQLNIDIPLIEEGNARLPIGKLSFNSNGRYDDYSDAGLLTTHGAGLTWQPAGKLQLIASYSISEDVPTLQELGEPVSVDLNARVYDFQTGETVENVTRISGGTPDLNNEERQVYRLNASFKPFEERDLTFTASYTDTSTTNAILEFPGLTPVIEAAFPDRVVRDGEGDLVSIDARPLNIAERSNRELRYGFNWSHRLQSPPRPELSQDERDQLRKLFFRRLDRSDRERIEERLAQRRAQSREQQDNAGPAQGQTMPQAGADGRRQGNPGGRGGRGGRGGGDRLTFSAFHTVALEDTVRIFDASEPLNLLDGDAIGTTGGTAEHRVQMQAGFSRGPLGGFAQLGWQGETVIDDGQGERLTFDDVFSSSLRLRYDFGNHPSLLLRYPILFGARASIRIDNLTDAKPEVANDLGVTPLSYQADLLEPRGRAVIFQFRKMIY